jgi:hypothetical protein
MFKSRETKFAWLFLQYPEIYPKSTNFYCLSHYRSMLCNWKYSHNCVPYFKDLWGMSCPNEMKCHVLMKWFGLSIWQRFSELLVRIQ